MNSGESPTNFKSKTTHLCLVSVMAATVMFDKLKLFSMKFISNPTLDDQNHPTRLFSHEWQNLWSCSLGPGDFHAHKENIDSTKISRDISILVRNRLEHNDPNPLYRNLRLLLPLYPIFFCLRCLKKTSSYGIYGWIYAIIKYILSSISMKFVEEAPSSEACEMNGDFYQGPLLCPTAFLQFINYLLSHFTSEHIFRCFTTKSRWNSDFFFTITVVKKRWAW